MIRFMIDIGNESNCSMASAVHRLGFLPMQCPSYRARFLRATLGLASAHLFFVFTFNNIQHCECRKITKSIQVNKSKNNDLTVESKKVSRLEVDRNNDRA